MQGGFLERIADELASNNVINSEDRELYTYGLRQGLLMLLNILTILIAGEIFGMLWQSVVFMVTYIPLRTYAGGYHARTQLRCYISSVVLIVAVLLGIRFIPWINLVRITVAVISGLVIYILSPVEDMNKPLDAEEVKVHGRKARIILAFEFGVLILLVIFGESNVAECMSVSLLALSAIIQLLLIVQLEALILLL